MKVDLITLAAFPFSSAESIHLAMFSKAMACQCDYRLVTPIKPWRPTTASARILDRYGIDETSFRQKKHFQFRRDGKDFARAAVADSDNRGALVYARHVSILEEALKQGVQCALEIHSLPDAGSIETIVRGFDSGLLRKVVVISDALHDALGSELEPHGFSPGISVARDAADEARFLESVATTETPKVGYLGSAYPGKGVEIIVPLAAACPQVEFVLYGMERSEIEARFGSLPENLKAKGKVKYARIPEVMTTFDIALLPNQPEVIMKNGDDIGKYTSPMKLFEYMAAGKAIIASDLPVIREVLTHNRDAILVPHDNVGTWASELGDLARDQKRRAALSKCARESFHSKHTYRARAKTIIDSLA